MIIRLLGSLEVEDAGVSIAIPGRREQMLLAVLALDVGVTRSVDQLIDALWGESLPDKPVNALQASVSRLRKAVGRTVIATRAPGYALDLTSDAVDATHFAELVARAEDEPDDDARRSLVMQALALWRGPALADFAGEEFAQREIGRLTELHRWALEMRIELDLASGRHAGVIPELEQMIADDPLRERLRRLHMDALYKAGRQAEALRVYQDIRRLLAEEIGVDPSPELQQFELQILEHADELQPMSGTDSPALPRLHNLPERVTSFIGRRAEIDTIIRLLAASRLVTLTGSGGAGKTSLAVESARHLLDVYDDGVWLIELAASGPADVVEDVAGVLGIDPAGRFRLGGEDARTPTARVVDGLRNRRTLLVLDNCEHVVDEVSALTGAILRACPQVDLLATSRERLDIPGEHVHRVPPLDSGGAAAVDRHALAAADAVRLFVDRARAADSQFDLDEDGVDAVATICRRLDGMPLAIELAAARTTSLTVVDIADRLGDVFRLLTGGSRTAVARHQTLRATVQWSYDLLTAEDREVFDRLCVFRGRFDLDAAAAVTGLDELDLLDVLARLVNRSMLIAEPTSPPAYRLLETMRAFGAERLAERDDGDAVRRRHFTHYRSIVAAAEPHLRGPDQIVWLDRIDDVIDNIRGALDWAVDADAAAGIAMAGELGWYAYLRGSRAEARARIGRLLDAGGRAAPPAELGKALFSYAMADPSPNLATADLDAARDLFAEAGDRWFATVCGALSATFRAFYGEAATALHYLDEAEAVMEELDDDWGRGLIAFLKANGATAVNDFATTQALTQRAQEYFMRSGDAWGIGYMEYFLGLIERTRGDYGAAVASFEDALARARVLGLRHEIPVMLAELANIATLQGDYAHADRLLDEAAELAAAAPFLGSTAMVHNARGLWWRHQGRLRRAYETHVAASQMYTDTMREGGVAFAEGSAGRAAEALGELPAARRHHLASIDAALTIGDHPAVAFAAEGMGGVAIAAGHARHGAHLLGAAASLRARLGLPLPSGEDFDVRRWEAAAVEDIGRAAFDEAANAGSALSLDGVVDAVRMPIPGVDG